MIATPIDNQSTDTIFGSGCGEVNVKPIRESWRLSELTPNKNH